MKVVDVLMDSDESAKINEMITRVAKLAAEDSLREDGFFFADGKYTASRLYKHTPGMINRTFDGHGLPVHVVQPLPDGQHVVTIGMDSICLWVQDEPAAITTVARREAADNQCAITGAATGGTRVAICAGMNPMLFDMDVATRAMRPRRRGDFGHDDVVTSCCFSPDGAVLVTASMDSTCIFWHVETMDVLRVLHAHVGGVAWCGFSRDGHRLVTCGKLDFTIKSWAVAPSWIRPETNASPLDSPRDNAATGGTTNIAEAQPGTSADMANGTGDNVSSSSGATCTKPQSTTTGIRIDDSRSDTSYQAQSEVPPQQENQHDPVIQASGASMDDSASCIRLTPDPVVEVLHDGPIASVEATTGEPSGRSVLGMATPSTTTTEAKDTSSGGDNPTTVNPPVPVEPPRPTKVDWGPRHKYNRALDALFSPDVTLQTLTLVHHLPEFCFNDDWCFSHRNGRHRPLKLPPLYEYIDTTSGSKGLREIDDDPTTLEQLDTIDILRLLDPTSSVLDNACEAVQWDALDIAPDDACVVTFERKDPQGVFVQHTHTINECVYDASGRVVVSVASDKCIKFWDASTGHHVHTIRCAHDLPIMTCAASTHASTQYVATGGSDGFVKIWHPTTYECVVTLRGHFDTVLSVAFTPSGHCVCSAARDAQVIKWQVVPMAPDSPKQPLVVTIDCHAIDIAWNEPLGNGARIEKYMLRISKMDGPYEPPFDVPADETKAHLDKLDPGCRYSFCVAAVNRIGASEFSTPTPTVETLAYRPSKLKKPCSITDVETRSVVLEWIAPSANGASISHYHIRCIPEDPCNIEPTVDLRVSMDEIDLELRAKEAAVQAELDRKAKIREERLAAAKARRPKRTEKSEARSATLRKQSQRRHDRAQTGAAMESPPPSSEGATVLVATKKPLPIPVPTSRTFKHKIPCIQAGTIYQFTIAAENRCGVGDPSVPSTYIKTLSCEPDQPVPPIVGNATPHSIDVTWVKPRHNGSEILHYTIEWEQEGRVLQSYVVLARSLSTTAYTIPDLAAGKLVHVRVGATNVIDNKLRESPLSAWSEAMKTLPSVPSAPEPPHLVDPTSHTLVVHFEAPCDNGRPILRYHAILFIEDDSYGVVSRRLFQQLVWPVANLPKSDEMGYDMPLVMLKASKRYAITIASENELGLGDYSPVSNATATKMATVPDTIREAPVVSNIYPTKLDLTWAVPSHDGGSALTAYALDYSINDQPFENEFKIQRLDVSLTLDFIKPKIAYCFRVAAVNAAGTAIYSPSTPKIITPSLVEHTLAQYFSNRPPKEHDGAKRVQRCYRQWKQAMAEKAAYDAYMKRFIQDWTIV
ncbi:Aste57867_17084 [Aphanomyces stellatus]|uniref:Aste57867_17084 protein n=1 Tax=Aphanomyces stellatus TaxID=120398 RepID=A0A485L6Z3_9STRA|nr:hypothetical protein As57867_017026 [Aphanomyces stellatus]VFT93844.1 Aste57867_17084 [Aphanomyces stellatus]